MDWAPRVGLNEEVVQKKQLETQQPQAEPQQQDSHPDQEGTTSVHGSAPDRSHDVRIAGSIGFCFACGAYATLAKDRSPKIRKGLLQKCPFEPAQAKGQLCRLKKGRHPTSGKYVGPVRKVTDWSSVLEMLDPE